MSQGSPVPAQIVSCADGATARAPTAETSLSSKTGCQLMPASVVFQIPPSAAPMYTVMLSPGTPVIDATRLPSGPRGRKCNAPSQFGPPSDDSAGGPPRRCARESVESAASSASAIAALEIIGVRLMGAPNCLANASILSRAIGVAQALGVVDEARPSGYY